MNFQKCLFALLFSLALSLPIIAKADASTRIPGNVVAAKVHGIVTATKSDGTQVQLTDAMVVTQQYVITTAAQASVILVFSNGATINLGADSSLSIEAFLQDPFRDGVALADLKEEPTTSETKLKLTRGELVGNVKHLKISEGSSFTVDTPVGAAGIRGTLFRIAFQTDANGQSTYSLSTAEGRILFQAATPAAAAVSVAAGTAVTATVDVHIDATTGAVTVTSPPVVSAVSSISSSAQQAISTAAKEIIDTSSAIILAPPPTTTSSTTPSSDKSTTATDDKTTTAATGTTTPANSNTPGSTTPITPPSPDTVSSSSH